MKRVLDIDLDFFVRPAAHWLPGDGPRLPEEHYAIWSPDEALEFLRGPCGLDGKLPGWVIEHHDEAFACWRTAIAAGQLAPPFHVTHLDAHADLGSGEASHEHLITSVMHLPVHERSAPAVVEPALTFGNWLAFAVACQWISDLDYVFGPGGGDDMVGFYMSDDYTGLQMRAASQEQFDRALHSAGTERLQGVADPVVPLRRIPADDFHAERPYDAIVLCRSPGYTPASADPILDLVRSEFIQEIV